MKKLYILVGIISFLICNSSCLAQKFSIGDAIDNAYIKKEKGTYTHYMQSEFVYLKGTNKYVYCIDPFDNISTTIDYDEHESNLLWYSKLDEKTWDRVVAAASFGYNYGKHTNDIWYSVTQLVIWRIVEDDADINFTDTFNGNVIHDYDDMIEELENMIDDYFDTSEIPNKVTLNYNEYDYYNLNDNYKVLENDKVVTMSNKRLKIQPNYVGTKDYTIYKGNEDNTVLYTDDTYQNLIYVYNKPYVEEEISVKGIGGRINVNINYQDIRNNTCINDTTTKYGLYDSDDNLIMEMEHNMISSYLSYGKYYIKQISVSCNYYTDDNIYDINLNSEEVIQNINVFQKLRTIQLQHNICINDECVREGNTTFIFKDESNNEIEVITDSNGIADVYLDNTKYYINQVDGDELYTYTNDYELDLCEHENDYFDVILNGYLYKADINVIVNDTKGNYIDNAKICIYDNEDNLIECNNTINGEVIFKKMIFGKYRIKEEDVPSKYVLNKDINEIEITKDMLVKIVNQEVIDKDNKKSYINSNTVVNSIENPNTSDININLFSYISGLCIIFLKILIKLC